MKRIVMIAFVLLSGCATTEPVSELDSPVYTTKILSHINYKNEANIAKNVLAECNLGTPLSVSVQKYARNFNIKVDRVDNIDKADPDNHIKIEIVSVMSRQRVTTALAHRHAKNVTIKATVFENGKPVHKMERYRSSKGGVFGGFKRSCSVLDRTVNTLGNDVAKLLNKFLKRRNKNI